MLKKLFMPALLWLTASSAAPAIAGPKIEHWELASGVKVYLVENHTLPMIDLQVDFAAGDAYDPIGKAGLAAMTVDMLLLGTQGLDEQELAEKMADSGAQFATGIDSDRSQFAVRTLSASVQRDAAVTLAAQVLSQPTFPAEAFARDRSRSIAGLKESLTRPGTVATRTFLQLLYPDHPYGQLTTVDSLTAITREDLQKFHQRYYVAANASVTIVGDASRAEADKIAQTLTAQLPAGSAHPPIPPVPATHAVEERIEHPSAQAHVLLGLPVLRYDDPDYYPLLVGNYVLGGGGFVSRLTKEVREKRGYAYSVYSAFMPNKEAGPFQIRLQTRGKHRDKALKVVRDVVATFIDKGASESELKAAKDNIINGFGLRLDSNRKILNYVAMIGFYDLPLDWLDQYTAAVERVTVAQIDEAFRRRVVPDQMVTVMVGGHQDVADVASQQQATAQPE